ncbi:sucrose nonfermenting 4-like protein isoform X1 [Zea mays]|uniref:Uncharacterized protein n=1 Tax=Zea mays TaxID=4577 RepID=A0A804LYE4_MAIZE|nr:sucrose nonfermenting 4-like protein isoform X1 [Zea mays]|eukprot:XP_023157177.1 sucrose nonfermenting 4-like protein isoform X1 [Zea mays]
MPPEPSSQNPSMQIAVIRHVVSRILLHNTIYDVVPLSSKLTALDTQLPVKQAFKKMHDEGLALVPLWDDRRGPGNNNRHAHCIRFCFNLEKEKHSSYWQQRAHFCLERSKATVLWCA